VLFVIKPQVSRDVLDAMGYSIALWIANDPTGPSTSLHAGNETQRFLSRSDDEEEDEGF